MAIIVLLSLLIVLVIALPVIKDMPLQQIFTRSRVSNAPVLFDDIPITASSLMIDIESMASSVRTVSGWLYSARPVGGGEFERSAGTLLLFGKNRRDFLMFPAPYFLQFFPARNVSVYQISVFSGIPVPPSSWVPIGNTYRFARLKSGSVEVSRIYFNESPPDESANSEFDFFRLTSGGPLQDVVEGFISSNYCYAKKSDGSVWRSEANQWEGFQIPLTMYQSAKSDPASTAL